MFRCTTAGTSSTEPTWTSSGNNNNTITSGTATFTNVTGQSTYFWAAAAGDLLTLNGAASNARAVAGDRIFVSSDHTETQTAAAVYGATGIGASFGLIQTLCVNRAGSTPPVAADLTTGATVTVSSGSLTLEALCNTYHQGITYAITSTSNITFNVNGVKSNYLKNCQLYLNTATTTSRITLGTPGGVVLDNTTVRFGNASQAFNPSSQLPFGLLWLNTPTALAGATMPTQLFQGTSAGGPMLVTARGVDFSGTTGSLVKNSTAGSKYLFDSCKIASASTRYDTTSVTTTIDLVELVNCYDGTNILNERYTPAGTLTTERTITLFGGATDDVGTFSHKLVSTANVDKYANFFESFWMDVEYTTTGASKTATVEIISSTALNNDEISLQLEYQGTAGSSLAAFADSLPATVLTTGSAVTTSTATWNSSPATPQKQHLQVTFTPQVAGRVRGVVRLGKASATVYINPQIAIT